MLHALELVADAAGDAAVRRDWQALRDAGLPSQLDHRGESNAPHLTLVAAASVAEAADRAVELIGPLLPVSVRSAGLLVLGRHRLTVARALDVPDALVSAVLTLRSSTSGLAHPGWLPHVTLARRVPREDAQRVVDAVGAEDVVIRLDTLRRWDPDERLVELLATVR
jgi:2'-5' RNA ligase superfamily protein